MAAVTGSTVIDCVPNLGCKVLVVETPATADDGDTVAIDLADYGANTFLGILGQTHSTTDSIIITEAPTTAVSGTTLTITIGGSTDDKKRVFIIFAK